MPSDDRMLGPRRSTDESSGTHATLEEVSRSATSMQWHRGHE